MNTNYANLDALLQFIRDKEKGHVMIGYSNLPGYAGMVLDIGIIFDIRKDDYRLDLQWISFGLDLYGENLLEGYSYKFETVEKLLAYIHSEYNISVTDIPIKFQFDGDKFPNPFKNEAEKPAFEEAWKRFKRDFRDKKFLDPSLELVYTTPPFAV